MPEGGFPSTLLGLALFAGHNSVSLVNDLDFAAISSQTAAGVRILIQHLETEFFINFADVCGDEIVAQPNLFLLERR